MVFATDDRSIPTFKVFSEMVWLELEKTGILQICYRFSEEKTKRSARTKDERKALTLGGRVEENLELIQRGRLNVPDDADIDIYSRNGKCMNSKKCPVKQVASSERMDIDW